MAFKLAAYIFAFASLARSPVCLSLANPNRKDVNNTTCLDRSTSPSLPRDRIFEQSLGPRKFTMYIPGGYDDAALPVPVIIYIHGQYGNSNTVGLELPFSAQASQPVISIYPQGVDDHVSSDCGTGWNVGPMGHDADTCKPASYGDSCCYESCRAQGGRFMLDHAPGEDAAGLLY